MSPSDRSHIVTRRTYNRPLNDEGTVFETWEQTVSRVFIHQQWLWERAIGRPLSETEQDELNELAVLMRERKVLLSGRTLWLGGTEVAQRREASMFNCSFAYARTVSDLVDIMWLLLQGCGVGSIPQRGVLNGFAQRLKVEVIRSKRCKRGGRAKNRETVYTETVKGGNGATRRVWKITVGDSAEAWAKAFGKLLAGKHHADVLILDFSQIRPGGQRLKGYGWSSSGDTDISVAMLGIANIMNERNGLLLSAMDILDIINHMGTCLSSRRSAEIMLLPEYDPEVDEFIVAKKDCYPDRKHRMQSNNSVMFYAKPSRERLEEFFRKMVEAGGSEPGFINAKAALKRAPWFAGLNPCAEILLGDKSFCNLVEVDLGKFSGDLSGLTRAIWIAARANYRQTCVDLRDGILQDSWHELNQFLRLCGVGLTGIVRWSEYQAGPEVFAATLRRLRSTAWEGANSMADSLGLPRAKNVTTVKPSGTLSKVMDTTEGVHKPLGRYIFNNVQFSKDDPLVNILRDAGYNVFTHPYSATSVLITLPVEYADVDFETITLPNGRVVEINTESAVSQLERYKLLMDNYVDQNCSVTISYDVSEVENIIDWMLNNWDTYVGVSFLFRTDPTKTAADLGYPYLPQEVKTCEEYMDYVARLMPFNLDAGNTFLELDADGCAGGVCPIR